MQVAAAIIVIVLLVIATSLWVIRPQTVFVESTIARDFPSDGFSHRCLEMLLERYVNSGDVDYEAWRASEPDVNELAGYLAAVATYSPETSPERFPTPNDELAYWIYGYNAYVLFSIISKWPVGRVIDLKAPIEPVEGFGFFYRNRFIFGGRSYSLLSVENDMIRARYKDPRIHFVLNCGSESCPPLRPELPVGEELESLLQKAAAEFVNDPENVAIDDENGLIALSAIFDMYEVDFLNDLKARAIPAPRGVIDYIAYVADDALRRKLESAADYDVCFDRFDWNVNAVAAR